MPTTETKRLTLMLSDREDGGLHIHSTDIPGLHMSGPDKAALLAKVPLAAKMLLKANRGMNVVQVYMPAFEAAAAGPSPRELSMHVREASLFVEVEPA